MIPWLGIIEKYRKFLPVSDKTPIVSLCEGNTPLIRADRLAKKICPQVELYLKVEGSNPTGSFKDRGMTLAVSKAMEKNVRAIMCASTGNTSAAAAASAVWFRVHFSVNFLIVATMLAETWPDSPGLMRRVFGPLQLVFPKKQVH